MIIMIMYHEASHCWYILSVMRCYRSHVLIIMISLLCLYQQSIFRFDWIWFLYEQEHKERRCRARCKVGSQNKSKSKILISQNYAIQIQNIRTINLQVLQPKADEARHVLPQVLRLRAPQLRQRHRPDLLHRHVSGIPVPRVRKVGKHFFLNFNTTQCFYKWNRKRHITFAQGRSDTNGGADQCARRSSKQSLSQGEQCDCWQPSHSRSSTQQQIEGPMILLSSPGCEMYLPKVWSVRIPAEAWRPLCSPLEHHQWEGEPLHQHHCQQHHLEHHDDNRPRSTFLTLVKDGDSPSRLLCDCRCFQIYVFLYLWFVFLVAVSGVWLVYRLLTIASHQVGIIIHFPYMRIQYHFNAKIST